MEQNKINVLLVKPNQIPKMVTINSDLKSLQNVVGGNIQVVYPFYDEVAIVCNDEGKLDNLNLNRGLFDENGNLYDIIAGNFFVCDCSGEDFGSLKEEHIAKYKEMFYYPEKFMMINGEITSVKIKPQKVHSERWLFFFSMFSS